MWYSYAIVRVVPRVERGEFLNVGVVLFAREQGFLGARMEVDAERLRSLAPTVDLAAVERHLAIFQAICEGEPLVVDQVRGKCIQVCLSEVGALDLHSATNL